MLKHEEMDELEEVLIAERDFLRAEFHELTDFLVPQRRERAVLIDSLCTRILRISEALDAIREFSADDRKAFEAVEGRRQ